MKIYELIRLAVEMMFTPISDDFYEKTPSSDYLVITRRGFLLFC